MSTSIFWELICDVSVPRSKGVKDSHWLNTRETGEKRRLHGPLTLFKEFQALYAKHICFWSYCFILIFLDN